MTLGERTNKQIQLEFQRFRQIDSTSRHFSYLQFAEFIRAGTVVTNEYDRWILFPQRQISFAEHCLENTPKPTCSGRTTLLWHFPGFLASYTRSLSLHVPGVTCQSRLHVDNSHKAIWSFRVFGSLANLFFFKRSCFRWNAESYSTFPSISGTQPQ